ncbi:MAG: lipid-binding SYLF domain-containing protein [Gammaproteobacteria bacterium]|nr:lipid-binding SYLF domain-containing protein [Gammaproteobacteria bacterium]
MSALKRLTLTMAVLVAPFLIASGAAAAETDAQKAQKLVNAATVTFQSFVSNPDTPWIGEHLKEARAVMIVPEQVKGAFIVGATGGTGVLLANHAGEWSDPAFIDLGGISFGLQVGAKASEVLLLAMTEAGEKALLGTKVTLGADVGIAAGPVGTGAAAGTVDLLAWSQSKGAYLGLALDGAVIAPANKWNQAYYLQDDITPYDIIRAQTYKNPKARGLVHAVAEAAD